MSQQTGFSQSWANNGSEGFAETEASVVKEYFQNVLQFIPDRISGDIPFVNYRTAFATPKKYLQFLKQLEKSSSRHDFLFWVFDIIAGGRDAEDLTTSFITAEELNEKIVFSYPYVSKILFNCADENGGIFSAYLLKMYHSIILPKASDNVNQHDSNTVLFTYPNTQAIHQYRNTAYKNLIKNDLIDANHDVDITIDPMNGLMSSDIPDPPKEVSYEFYDFPDPPEKVKYEGFDYRKASKQSFFSFYNYFWKLLTFSGRIHGSSDCILVQKDPYKRLQIEKFMKNINVEKLVEFDVENDEKDSIVVVACIEEINKDSFADFIIDENTVTAVKNRTAASDSVEGFIETSQEYTFKKLAQRIVYKRAKLVSLSTKDLITVLFVDYGEVVDVPVADIYMYKFSKKVPEFLTVLVSEDKLAKTLQLNDLYIFDFIKEKYIYVGRPTSNFDIAPNPLNDLSTSTESVYFGPGSNDWENEESKNDDEILFVPAAEENKTKKDDELVVYGLEDGWTFEDDANEDSDDSSFVEFESIRNTALENDEDDDYYADQGSVGSRSE